MFGVGPTEFLVIMVVALLVLGPEHLPRIMRTVNKVMSDFRRVSTEFQRAINLEAQEEEWQRRQTPSSSKKAEAKKKTAPPAASGTTVGKTPENASTVAPKTNKDNTSPASSASPQTTGTPPPSSSPEPAVPPEKTPVLADELVAEVSASLTQAEPPAPSSAKEKLAKMPGEMANTEQTISSGSAPREGQS